MKVSNPRTLLVAGHENTNSGARACNNVYILFYQILRSQVNNPLKVQIKLYGLAERDVLFPMEYENSVVRWLVSVRYLV